jgi:hypothetical protein
MSEQTHLRIVPEPPVDGDELPDDDWEEPQTIDAYPDNGVRRATVLYIDADNQSPQLATPLLNTLIEVFTAQITAITIAGNNLGKQVDCWHRHLIDHDPDLAIRTLTLPSRKEAADIALILELGTHLEHHIREQSLVIIMSRDDLLIGAAEQAKARGARVLLAYADSAIPSPGNADLTTLLLPSISKSPAKKPLVTTPLAKPATTISSEVPTVDKTSVASVVAALHKMCPEQPGGGYTASHVGQALAKLDFDAKARKQFLKTVPNLSTKGTGSKKLLLF